MKKLLNLKALSVLGLLLLIGLVFMVGSSYQEYQNVKKNSPEYIVKRAGELVTLPDEPMTFVQVVDREQLKKQPFYSLIENGDVLILFAASKKTVIFRPALDRVISVSDLSGQSEEPL